MDKHPFSIANDWGRYCTIKVRNGDTAENTLHRLILLDQFIRLPAPEFIDYAINKLPQPSIVVVNEPTRAHLSTNFKPICNYISQGLLGTILLVIHSHYYFLLTTSFCCNSMRWLAASGRSSGSFAPRTLLSLRLLLLLPRINYQSYGKYAHKNLKLLLHTLENVK